MNNKNLPLVLGAIAIGIVAAWLRFYQLPDYPAGFLLDEIWMALNARGLREGVTPCCPLYFSLPFGGHPLFIYLSWVAQSVGAPSPLAGRIVSASLGAASVVALLFMLRALARSMMGPREANWVGTIGAASLAVTVSHITFSRLGLETLLASVFAVPLILLTWLTFEKDSFTYAVLSGLVLGLSLYSYAPTAAFVITVAAYGGWRWLTSPRDVRARFAKLAFALLLSASVVVTPFVYTVLFTPTGYFGHLMGTTQATRSGGLPSFGLHLAENAVRTVWGVSVAAPPDRVLNFQGRPLFPPILSLFFWVGVLAALIGAWRKQTAPQWMIVWAVGASLPTLTSDQAPHLGRWLQALPAFAFFIGYGALLVWRWGEQSLLRLNRWPRLKPQAVDSHLSYSRALLSLLSVGAAVITLDQAIAGYFWTPAEQRDQMHGASQRLSAEKAISYSSQALVFVSPTGEPLIQPVFDLLFRDTRVHQIDGRVCLPLAWEASRPTIYSAVTLADKITLDRLQALYPSGRLVAEFLDWPHLYPYSQFYEVPAGVRPDLAFTQAQTDFAGGVELMGYELPTTATPGGVMDVNLYWRLNQPSSDEILVFVHLGRAGELQPLAQHDGPPCAENHPTTGWATNVVYPDQHIIQLPPDLKAGVYEVRVGLYRWPALERLDVIRSHQPVLENNILALASVTVEAR